MLAVVAILAVFADPAAYSVAPLTLCAVFAVGAVVAAFWRFHRRHLGRLHHQLSNARTLRLDYPYFRWGKAVAEARKGKKTELKKKKHPWRSGSDSHFGQGSLGFYTGTSRMSKYDCKRTCTHLLPNILYFVRLYIYLATLLLGDWGRPVQMLFDSSFIGDPPNCLARVLFQFHKFFPRITPVSWVFFNSSNSVI